MNIKLDVLIVQIIHVVLLIYIFNAIFGKSLADALIARKELQKKLENADETYAEKIAEADAKATDILSAAYTEKQKILADAQDAAKRVEWKILADAEKQKETMIRDAQEKLAYEKSILEWSFVSLVKDTSKKVLQKIGTEKAVQDAYVDAVISQLHR